jgi:DNA-binding transcriptional ArsR family regulator
VAGYWQAPRALARILSERQLSLTAYALLHFIAESGADRPEGLATTNEFLASALGLNERTIRRGLRSLRRKGLVDYRDHERIAMFTVRTGDGLRTLLRTPLRTPEPPAVSAEPADSPADTFHSTNARKLADEARSSGDPSADTRAGARGRAETDTDTETSFVRSSTPIRRARDAVARTNERGNLNRLNPEEDRP